MDHQEWASKLGKLRYCKLDTTVSSPLLSDALGEKSKNTAILFSYISGEDEGWLEKVGLPLALPTVMLDAEVGIIVQLSSLARQFSKQ